MLSKDKLEALARYAPILEAQGFAWGEWKIPPGQVPWMEHGDVASSFMHDAYRYDWVSSDFDWPRWTRTAEARRLREDPSALADAVPNGLSGSSRVPYGATASAKELSPPTTRVGFWDVLRRGHWRSRLRRHESHNRFPRFGEENLSVARQAGTSTS